MSYECEFIGGHVSPVEYVRHSTDYLIGLATREDGKRRCVFFSYDTARPDPIHHPDPWIAAVRHIDAALAYRLRQLEAAPGAAVNVKA